MTKKSEYLVEHNASKTRDAFIRLMTKKYPHLQLKTIKRRWCDRKHLNLHSWKKEFSANEMDEPSPAKMVVLKDLVAYANRRGRTVTKDEVIRYMKATTEEINWLIQKNIL